MTDLELLEHVVDNLRENKPLTYRLRHLGRTFIADSLFQVFCNESSEYTVIEEDMNKEQYPD